ncbi:MAG: hypothetical protein CVT99_13015 [Bacteroidetes bacterium HGW-Bacteroidetes-16]|jgi:hypothetical protein|nr:MAG: hypothetical protein CVT99_13015 [Bacteroidetes bacterium HGW-Bacteroidetes-16]
MKRVMIKNRMLIAFTILVLGFTSCDKKEDAVATLNDTLNLKTNEASQTDLDGLIYMREEEKLARDVYVYLNELYQIPVFENIAKSEDFHTNQVLALINFYGLTDPALPELGKFSNVDLQALYDDLIVKGQDSLIAGLIVGATIEEVDILDLEAYLSQTTSDTIKTLYTNLLRASGYHLKAFNAQLAFRGITYVPQFLTREQFDAIINSNIPAGGGICLDSLVYAITDNEEAALLFMREEEKLAHDVYVNLFNQWNVPVFNFISRSENIHTTQVLSLINFFNLEDPASVNPGEFNNPDLQILYDQLLVQGSESLISALTVGATIEEVDIVDLTDRMAQSTNNSILAVFGNLTKGSKAHLRAFVAQLQFQGVTYVPQFLTQEEFDAIINGD